MSSALDLGFYAPAIRVTDRAIRQRLAYEGVSYGRCRQLIDSYRAYIERVMLDELHFCRHLLPQARSVLCKPWRDFSNQKLSRHKRVHGPDVSSRPFRSVAGEYYLHSDRFCYVVDHLQVVTMIMPTQGQVEVVEYVMGPYADVPQPVSITEQVRDVEPTNSSRRMISELVQRPRSLHVRKPIPIESMSRKPASWAYMVLDDVSTEGGGDISSNEVLVRRAMVWLRETYGDQLPEPIYVDALGEHLLKQFQRRFSFLRILPLLPPPRIDWTNRGISEQPASIRQWWKRVLKLTPSGNQLVTFLLPETARMIHEITSSDGSAEWRKDPHFFDPGRTYDVHRK